MTRYEVLARPTGNVIDQTLGVGATFEAKPDAALKELVAQGVLKVVEEKSDAKPKAKASKPKA